MRKRTYGLCGVAALAAFMYLNNASWLARPSSGRPIVLAHRGVHQRSVCINVRADSCTASCIAEPTHRFIENTLPSMKAAFDAGADVIELDVHPTTDGQLAVFHDWRLECRTNGSGVTREQSMAYLKSLDLGYGYTSDGGKTFPLRGSAVGLMPTLVEVLDAFPDRRFLIHLKDNEPEDGELLARVLLARPAAQRSRLLVYGGERPVDRVLALLPDLRGLSRASAKSCAIRYALIGWTGHVPDVCRHSLLILPLNRAKLLWGWPHRFIARMQEVGTEVFVANDAGEWLGGIDTFEDFTRLTQDRFSGGIWTDQIERIGPLGRP